MKAIVLLSAAFLLTVSPGFAEPPAKKEETAKQETPAEPAEAWVAKLYALAKNNKGPFFQTKDKATLNRWLAKDLADLVLKDAVASEGEVGVLDFDPLYNAQDTEIKDFKIGQPKAEGTATTVAVSFKNFGDATTVTFLLAPADDKSWRISDIRYPDKSTLKGMYPDALKATP